MHKSRESIDKQQKASISLELEHIQHYPMGENGVKLMYGGYGDPEKIVPLFGVNNDNDIPEIRFSIDGIVDTDVIDWCKPILRPFSDLIKPITVPGYNDGKEFVPMERLFELWCRNKKPERHDYSIQIFTNFISCSHASTAEILEIKIYDIFKNSAWIVKLLYSWHFAINLPEGSWIDINTVNI